jgi:hypothetical protein
MNDPRYLYLARGNGIERILFNSASAWPYTIAAQEPWWLNVTYYLKETRTGQLGSPPANVDVVAYGDPSKGATLFKNYPQALALARTDSNRLYGGFRSGEIGDFPSARTEMNPLALVISSVANPGPPPVPVPGATDWFFDGPTGIASSPQTTRYTLVNQTDPPRPVNVTPADLGIIYDISIDPGNPNTLLVATSNGVYRSINAGRTFTLLANKTNCYATLIDPTNVTYFFFGTEDGLYRSKNGGATWTNIQSGLSGTRTIYSFTLSPGPPGSKRRIWVGTSNGVFADGRSLDLE